MKNIALLKWNLNKVDGGVKVAIELANELANYHNVFLIDIASTQKNRNNLPFILDDKVFFNTLVCKNARVRAVLFQAIFSLRKFIKDNKIDIILSIGTLPNLFWFLAKIGLGTKVIYADHMSLDYNHEGRMYNLFRLIGAKFSNKIITLTESNKNKYIKKYNLPKNKVDFIYNWINESSSNNKYNVASTSLITVGRFSKQKGFDLLAKVASIIMKKYPQLSWDIYGDGDEVIKSNFLSEISRNGISNQIFLKGNIKGEDNIYPEHSIYIMTSYFEGLPLVLLEAQQYKLPIVSFNCSTGPSEIIRDNVNGFLIENYNVNLMVEKLSLLIENEELRKSFSDNALLDIDKFSRSRIIKQWLNLIEIL